MVTYSYSLNPSGSASIQQVINNITAELSSNPSITRDIEVILAQGNYAGFTIPTGALYPLFGTIYRLIIRAGGDFFPIIDFNQSSPTQWVGADIGSGNPNVTIKNIRIQYFPIGVRAGLNSHFPIVKNCIVNNNRNVGILFEQASEAQALQNIVINGDYGIVCRLTKNAAIFHNTIFMNGAISTNVGTSISCVWVELAHDYGNGLADTGYLYMVGNIGWNTSGRCLTLHSSDIDTTGAIRSNYNDWVVGDPENFIAIEDNVFSQGPNANIRQTFTNLMDWKLLGYDANSISEDPKFISAVRIKSGINTGFAIDLNLLPVSPVLSLVPSFAFNSVASALWVPSYVDSAFFARDILRLNRTQEGTAAGANEQVSTSGFFGQDIFSNPLDLGLAKECGIDPFANILFKSLDLWYPRVNKGYFYSNEREYYLYAAKGAAYIGGIAATKFFLPGTIAHNRPIKVRVSGKLVDETSYDFVSDQLILYHKGLSIETGEEEVEVEGEISNWKGYSFIYSQVVYRLKINEGITSYLLPDDYKNEGPITITDDISYPTDSDYISNREFYTELNKEYNRTEIKFANNTNLLLNAQFDYNFGGTPSFWETNTAQVSTASSPLYSVAGGNVCKLEDDSHIKKLLPVNTEDHYSLSFHARSMGSGSLHWELEFFDSAHTILGVKETGSFFPNNEWERKSILINTTGQDYNDLVPDQPVPCTNLVDYVAPTRSAYVSFKLTHNHNPAYTGAVILDALQYEKTPVPTLYHRKHFFSELTIEYESSIENEFVDTNLSISPVINLMTDAFLYIPEVPAMVYGGPTSPAITTLHEYGWPKGRLDIMPWSRTKGKDKLRKRPKNRLHRIPEVKSEIISPVNGYAQMEELELIPSIPSTYAGDENGVGFFIRATDSDGNPHALMPLSVHISDNNLRYPGILSKRKYGLKEKLSTFITDVTNNAGILPLIWIPPQKDAGTYRGPIPTPSLTSTNEDLISVIKTDYPVNLESFGNVTILDDNQRPFETYSKQATIEIHIPALSRDSSAARLKYPIKRGSVRVLVDGVQYTENQINILTSDQFFVNYEDSLIIVNGRVDSIYVEYSPSYIYISESDPYKILIYHNKVFNTYANNIVLGYDFVITLSVGISDPINSNTFNDVYALVAQHSLSQKSNTYNPIALEF